MESVPMRVITTVHKAGFDQYGKDWLDGLKHWPDGTEFIVYAEGFDYEYPGVTFRRIESVDRAEAFKKQYAHYKPVLWQWDVIRWCNKVFANYDAFHDYTGLGIWLDCDCVTFQPMTKEYVESLLPKGNYLSAFKRVGMPTETGFVVRDCSHPQHKKFMDVWVNWLESGAFKGLGQWCDAATMDATIRLFEKQGLQTHSLSGAFEKELNPMDLADLSRKIVHRKGSRKWLPKDTESVLK